HNFDVAHTMDQFDDTFRRYLGPWLYTPSDFLSRNPSAATLTDVAREAGWPTIVELRGRFIVNLLGNFSTAGSDWVNYATTDMHNRVAFPMQSVLVVNLPVVATPSIPRGFFGISVDGTEVLIGYSSDNEHFPGPHIDPVAHEMAFANSV